MPQQTFTKNLFTFNKGLNTESNEIGFPDGYSSDERNYVLQVDGTRRRRKALDTEASGADKTIAANANGFNSTYVWTNVGGDPEKTFVVHKFGSILYFTDDAELISTTYHTQYIELDNYLITGASVSCDAQPAQFTSGRGYLLITAPGIYPLYVDYDSAGDVFTVESIDYQIRDYTDQNDGIAASVNHTVLTDELRYNLLNRGWRSGDITTFFSDEAVYPNKSVPWHKGYRRTYATNIYERHGDMAWNSDKYLAEPATNTKSNNGSLIMSVTDSTEVVDTSDPTNTLACTLQEIDTTTSTWRVRLTFPSAHGYATSNNLELTSDFKASYATIPLGYAIINFSGTRVISDVDQTDTFVDGNVTTGTDRVTITAHPFIDGAVVQLTSDGTLPAGLALATTYYVEVIDANTVEFYSDEARLNIVDITAAAGGGTHTITETTRWIEFEYTEPSNFLSMLNADYSTGSIVSAAGSTITRPDGVALARGPRACAFHDGRLFLAGLDDNVWSDYVFFSQIAEKPQNFGKCYQEADPTDFERNEMVASDGGWLAIQGIQGVQRMLSVRQGLLIFALNGVWEISGGQRGFFTPDGYSVRKVTDEGCNSPLSPIALGNKAVYTGPEGVFWIAPNQYTGILEAQSVSRQLVQTKWNAISEAEQKRAMTVFDDSSNQLYILYGKSVTEGVTAGSYYDRALIMNLTIQAWSFYQWNGNTGADYGIMSAFAITKTDTTNQPNKVKFVVGVTDATTARVCDHNQTDYIDFDGTESPLPYVVSGWDNLGEFQRRKQAPIITVYAKRTETGYTSSGNGWAGDNPSSSLMTAYWDWTDDSVTGKVGAQQETYRHLRAFVPSGASDVDGYPVVVTRNKVRGRGRVLQIRFDGAATKDSYLMGFSTNYKLTRNV